MCRNIERLKINKIEFISLELAKHYLRVDHNEDDVIIKEMLEIAVVVAENYLCINLNESSWKITIYEDLPFLIKLLNGPIVRVDSFKIYQNNGEILSLTDHHFMLDKYSEVIKIRQFHSIEKAEIIYHTGCNPSLLPSPIRQGVLEHLVKMYDLRGSDQGIPLSVKSIYQPYKKVRF